MNEEKKMIPTNEECFLLLGKFQVPSQVIAHSRVVHQVAFYLCQSLNLQGEGLDAAKVEAGALLHDIAKVRSPDTEESHAQAGSRILSRLGFPEVAEIVRQHVVLDHEAGQGAITEAEVVYYADKRVKHTAVVSLRERFQDLRERYGKRPEDRAWLESMERQTLFLEERIFQRMPLRPESLGEALNFGY